MQFAAIFFFLTTVFWKSIRNVDFSSGVNVIKKKIGQVNRKAFMYSKQTMNLLDKPWTFP